VRLFGPAASWLAAVTEKQRSPLALQLTLGLSNWQILELYKQYIDPDFTWQNFTLEEQAKVIVAPRSNNLLDTARVGGGSAQKKEVHSTAAMGPWTLVRF
jgi:hypothetical protein